MEWEKIFVSYISLIYILLAMAAFYPETAELRETLWPPKPVASTI